MLSWALLALACVLCMQATPEPAGHPRGVLCPSGVGPGLLRAVVNDPIRPDERGARSFLLCPSGLYGVGKG